VVICKAAGICRFYRPVQLRARFANGNIHDGLQLEPSNKKTDGGLGLTPGACPKTQLSHSGSKSIQSDRKLSDGEV